MRLRCIGVLFAALLGSAAPTLGAEAWRLVSVEPAPPPEPPLPQQLLEPRAPLPARILLGAGALTLGDPWRHRLCTRPAEARERVLRGLREAAASPEPSAEVLEEYGRLLEGCPERRADAEHARWLLHAAAREQAGTTRDLLYEALARVHPLRAPEPFEGPQAPDDAVVTYHSRRSGADGRMHSTRLAQIVARRLDAGDPRALEAAARALARLDHPRVVPAFESWLGRAPDGPLRGALWRALRASPRPEGRAIFARHCEAWLDDAKSAWRAHGAPPRGSPTRFGDPCAPDGRAWMHPPEARHARELPPAACARLPWHDSAPPARPGACIELPAERALQFQGDDELLRRLARWLEPHLGDPDGAAFVERWPAMEAVGLDHGDVRTLAHVRGGDAIFVRVPGGSDGGPDEAYTLALASRLDAALDGERRLDVHIDGTRRRHVFSPCGRRWCAAMAVGIVNELLETRGAPVRVRREAAPHALRLRVVSASGGAGVGAR